MKLNLIPFGFDQGSRGYAMRDGIRQRYKQMGYFETRDAPPIADSALPLGYNATYWKINYRAPIKWPKLWIFFRSLCFRSRKKNTDFSHFLFGYRIDWLYIYRFSFIIMGNITAFITMHTLLLFDSWAST